MTKFAGMVSPTSVSFTGIDGKNHVISTGHPNNERVRQLMRETQNAFKGGDETEGKRLWQELTDLADIPAHIEKASAGRVTVKDGTVYYNETPIHNAVTQRILWTIQEGYDATSYMAFLDNLMSNPSKRAVTELFGFLEACQMGITEDGCLIAYKKVRDNYRDIYTGKFDHSVGKVLEMQRNEVDDDKDRTCSTGFHFCSFTYLPHFGAGSGNRIVIVKVNPRDVVSIPSDYNNAKARTCRYEVIGEYDGADKADILSGRSVWTTTAVRENFGNDDYGRKVENEQRRETVFAAKKLEILIDAMNDADNGDLDGLELDGSTTLGDLKFSVRSRLAGLLEDEFGVWDCEAEINDDATTLADLANLMDDDQVTDRFDEEELGLSDDSDESEGGEDTVTDAQPAAPVVTGDATVQVPAQATVVIYSEQNGADTRWVAECRDCNNGAGWKQTYARKRDARRGIKRTLGDSVAIVEKD